MALAYNQRFRKVHSGLRVRYRDDVQPLSKFQMKLGLGDVGLRLVALNNRGEEFTQGGAVFRVHPSAEHGLLQIWRDEGGAEGIRTLDLPRDRRTC